MTEVLRYEGGSGAVLVEADENSYGVERPARNEQGILGWAGVWKMRWPLAAVRPAAAAAVEAMRELAPEQMEIEFGVKLAGSPPDGSRETRPLDKSASVWTQVNAHPHGAGIRTGGDCDV